MYLDGQLPYGPPSSNVGAPPIPTFDQAAPEVTYLLPGGGDQVVSATLANFDGIVQYPETVRKTAQFDALRTATASYGKCGDYAANGSLTTIANESGRGLSGLGMCQSGAQDYQPQSVQAVKDKAAVSIFALLAGLAAIVIVTPASMGTRR